MTKKPSLFIALLPIIILIIMLTSNVFLFENTLDGANQISLLLAAFIGMLIAWRLGYSWDDINHRIIKTIGSAMPSMIILLLIGSLAGTWLISGIIPTMIYYGLDIINPTIFLVATVVVSSIVSLVTGSSWSTVATIGVALLGIGKTLGFSEPIIAGAIISGAYFGDKMSPLSDTTNLAPAMTGTDLFTHIRYMTITTIPAMAATLVIFTIFGLFSNYESQSVNVSAVKTAIDASFNITPILFLVPLILFTIIVMKVPAIPAMLIGSLLGGIFAVVFQPELIQNLASNSGSFIKASYVTVMQSMFGKISVETSNPVVNELLSTSGMSGMLNTVWLILSAMIFGGVLEGSGLLERITRPIVEKAKSTGSLVASTVVTCMFFNTTASDQYISIVVPGRMFKDSYAKKGLKPEVLSRTLEDSGTMTSVLVPWNTCGATQATVLGVPTITYLPYCFFNLFTPLVSILFAYTNFKIRKIENSDR